MVRRTLTYSDAVRVLGGGESALLRHLDHASSAAMLALGGFNFFEARQEIVRLGGELVEGLGRRLRGIDRMTRTERLQAAHSVLIVTAYFDVLGDSFALLRPGGTLDMSAGDQISLVSGERVEVGWRDMAHALTDTGLGGDVLLRSRESTLDTIETRYRTLSGCVGRFLSGLALWDDLDESERLRFAHEIDAVVPVAATNRYEEQVRRLAAECVEFGVWLNIAEHEATRAELTGGLVALETLLRAMASDRVPDAYRKALAVAHHAVLDKPITLGSEVSGGLQIPTLGESYIEHRFRAAALDSSSKPGQESWWNGVPLRSDVHRFLAGFLTSEHSTRAPLLVLGQPGSGKSVLTRVLAARLPAADFLPVRVELRQTPAEADVQAQIEMAVRASIGEALHWPRLVESSDGALPVVLLDGFDEMLQATGVSHTDFLLKVAAFQERESDVGRPVVVIVTSRIAVADRAAVPAGAVAVRLEPFDDDQIGGWLEVWRRTNAGTLAGRGKQPLPVETALLHRDLAAQPLLLLMLALYDAEANALQGMAAELGRTELYEQLLGDFARREVRKHSPAALPEEVDRLVERELLRLSVVAFAMFNRRSQWVGEADLNQDLAAVLGEQGSTGRSSSLRTPLSAAETVVGRFFFVHESHAMRDGRRLQTFEFLHATFGEFLVARLAMQVLTDMVNRETATVYALPGAADDGLLHALLSFAALTSRSAIVVFLRDLIARLSERQRTSMADLLLRLHARALQARTDAAYADYEPRRATMTERHAAWSANLVLLATLVAGEVTAGSLFPYESEDAALAWHDQAMMWRAQLPSEGWAGLMEAIAVERVWVGERREVRLRPDDGSFTPPATDLFWTYMMRPNDPSRTGSRVWLGHTPPAIHKKSFFTTGKSGDVMDHALQPIGNAFPSLANMLIAIEPDRLVSATHVLLAALVAPYRPDEAAATVYTDLMRVVREIGQTTTQAVDRVPYLGAAIGALLTAALHGAVSAEALVPLVGIPSVREILADPLFFPGARRVIDEILHAYETTPQDRAVPEVPEKPGRIRFGTRVRPDDGGPPVVRYEAS